jgi:hypothetical protein
MEKGYRDTIDGFHQEFSPVNHDSFAGCCGCD